MTQNYENLFFKAGSVFSPAAPVDKRALFAGRIQQLSRVIDAINTRGQHAIVFGERGVGKTSLANIVHETLDSIGLKEVLVNRVNCDSTDDFSSIWKKALKSIIFVSETSTVGFEPETKQYVMDLSQGLGDKIVPDEICRALQKSHIPVVFIFDEFDRINDPNSARLFADTMKSLSDNSIKGTLILVGVADDVEELIKGHESVARSLIQIKLPRMSASELKEILDRAMKELTTKIDEDASERLIRLSQGLPHYIHLLGLSSVREALRKESLIITLDDVKHSIRMAIENAQQTVLSSYQKATSSPHKAHLYKEVLLSCALAKGDELSYFAATDVRNPLSRILGRNYEITAFSIHLNNFCQDKRGSVLIKTGEKRGYRYRFRNPLLPPFIIMRGLADGILNENNLDLIPIWSA